MEWILGWDISKRLTAVGITTRRFLGRVERATCLITNNPKELNTALYQGILDVSMMNHNARLQITKMNVIQHYTSGILDVSIMNHNVTMPDYKQPK